MQLRQSHQASIREVSRVPLNECRYRRNLVLQPEDRLDDASRHQLEDRLGPSGQATDQVGSLRKNRLASEKWRGQTVELFRGPAVVAIAAVEEGYDGPGIDDRGPQRP